MFAGRTIVFTTIIASCIESAPENLALNKPAFESSMYPGSAQPSAAVDGVSGPCNFYSLQTTSTNQNDLSPWFGVDLLGRYEIHNITIYNRGESFPERLYGLIIDVFDDNFDRCTSAVPSHCANITGPVGVSEDVSCTIPPTGRFIRIWKHTGAHFDDLLHLCEIQVYGSKADDECENFNYRRMASKRLESSGVTSVSNKDKFVCVQSCALSGACVGVNHNNGTGDCELIPRPESTDTVSSSSEWMYYGHDLC